MEIKDIVEQQKLEKALERSKKKQDDFTRKEFLKDCYKFWKEYKKVEHTYTWWSEQLTRWFKVSNILCPKMYYLWWLDYESPLGYYKDSWFYKKWKVSRIQPTRYLVKRKVDPTTEGVLIKCWH